MQKRELISSFCKDDKEQAVKDKEEAEKSAEKAEKDLHSLEERRERLQPVMDNVSKEIKEYGTVKAILPEAGTLERATTYRDKKIKPLFTQMKNKNCCNGCSGQRTYQRSRKMETQISGNKAGI